MIETLEKPKKEIGYGTEYKAFGRYKIPVNFDPKTGRPITDEEYIQMVYSLIEYVRAYDYDKGIFAALRKEYSLLVEKYSHEACYRLVRHVLRNHGEYEKRIKMIEGTE